MLWLAMKRKHELTLLFRNLDESPLGCIDSAGFVKDSTDLPENPMRILGDYAMVYLLDGAGRYKDSKGMYQEVRPGDLIFVFPEIAHCYGPARSSQRWDEFFLVFRGPVFDLWRKEGLLNPATPVWHLEPIAYWLRRFQETVPQSTGPGPKQSVECTCRLQQALANAWRETQRGSMAEADEAWLAHAYALLEADTTQPMDYAKVAQQLGTSYETFRKRFVWLAGVSPGKYRMSRVMERACDMMHKGHPTNRELALALGFSDEYHFSRRFKQVIGKSPNQFRSHWVRQ